VVEKKLGHELERVEEAEDDPDIQRAVPVDTASLGVAQGALIGGPFYVGACSAIIGVTASGGTLYAIAMAGLIGGLIGLVIGLLLAVWVNQRHARQIKDQIDHGGLLLWIHIRDDEREERAKQILSHHVARDVHMHDLPA